MAGLLIDQKSGQQLIGAPEYQRQGGSLIERQQSSPQNYVKSQKASIAGIKDQSQYIGTPTMPKIEKAPKTDWKVKAKEYQSVAQKLKKGELLTDAELSLFNSQVEGISPDLKKSIIGGFKSTKRAQTSNALGKFRDIQTGEDPSQYVQNVLKNYQALGFTPQDALQKPELAKAYAQLTPEQQAVIQKQSAQVAPIQSMTPEQQNAEFQAGIQRDKAEREQQQATQQQVMDQRIATAQKTGITPGPQQTAPVPVAGGRTGATALPFAQKQTAGFQEVAPLLTKLQSGQALTPEEQTKVNQYSEAMKGTYAVPTGAAGETATPTPAPELKPIASTPAESQEAPPVSNVAQSIDKEVQQNLDPTQGFAIDDSPEKPLSLQEQVSSGLDNLGQLSSGSLMTTLQQYGVDFQNMSSSEMLQTMLLQQNLQIADDPTVQNYLMKNAETAQSTYLSAIETYKDKMNEIDKIISGEEVVPTSFESLAAKAYSQSKDLNLESISAEKEYMQKEYDVWKQQETEKRSRLEGYLKAKLYAAGAQDSSAGLATMALSVHAADLNIQLKQAEYTYSMSKLNIQSRQIMTDFTNKVVEIGMTVEAQKGEAGAAYDEKMTEIEGQFIASEKEKSKLKLEALSTFTEKMQVLDKEKKEEERYWYEQKYKEIRDSVEDSYKLSGIMGSYFTVDDQGNVVDTGVPTFAAKQWEDSYMLDTYQFQHNVQNDSFNQGIKLLENYGSASAPYVEQLLGMPQGSLASLQTVEEQKNAANDWMSALGFGANMTGDVLQMNALMESGDGAQGLFSTMYPEGYYSSKQYGDLQCAEFLHKFYDFGTIGSTIPDKLDLFKNKDRGYIPKVGDSIITNESKQYGHVAIINSISADGTLTLTEANYKGKGVVTHDRKMSLGDAHILGFHTGNLKPDIEKQLQSYGDMKQKGGAYTELGSKLGPIASIGIKIAGNYFKAQAESIDPFLAIGNDFMKAQIEAPQQKIQQSQFPPQAITAFKAYEKGEKWVTEGMSMSDRLQFETLHNLYKSSDLTGMGNDINQAFNDVKNSISLKLSDTKSGLFSTSLEGYLSTGNYDGAKDFVKRTIVNTDDVETKKKVLGTERTIDMLSSIKNDLALLEQSGVDTGIFTGTEEDVAKSIGKTLGTGDLAYIATKVQKTIQTYRKDMSGAAFTESENAEYKSMFPSLSKTKELNMSQIDSLMDTLGFEQKSYYSSQIGDAAYNQLFGESYATQRNVGGSDLIQVMSPTGQQGYIPASEFSSALEEGYIAL